MRRKPEREIAEVIASAEKIGDPLAELVERTFKNPSAPLAPDVVKSLIALKVRDDLAFEELREQLKGAGCRITALDRAIAGKTRTTGEHTPTQTEILLALADTANLFHAADSTCYADLIVNGHRETWPIRSRSFRQWLARHYYEATQRAPNSEALHAALNIIEAQAHFDGPERAVHVRVAALDDAIYLDLGDPSWRAVRIDTEGWLIIKKPRVRFRRPGGMKPLPEPERGGSITALRPLLNVRDEADFALAVAWLLAALRGHGPYPVLVLTGEQGSAKSTFSAILRALLDPNTAPLRSLPREDRDLFIAANNAHILAFDNVSGLPGWISDTVCRLATGGGFAVRQLYSDQEEVLFDATRPIILNGIEDIVARPDLADRAIILSLEGISEKRCRAEQDLWAAFESERGWILGALLDAVVDGLRNINHVHLERLPRMADFALWVSACEKGLWREGTFLAAYSANRAEAVDSVLEADVVAATIQTLIARETNWTGTAAELLTALGALVGERVQRMKSWPITPRALSGRLRRATTFLRKVGIQIDFTREGRRRIRTIHIASSRESVDKSASVPSASTLKDRKGNGAWTGAPTAADCADTNSDGWSRRQTENPQRHKLR